MIKKFAGSITWRRSNACECKTARLSQLRKARPYRPFDKRVVNRRLRGIASSTAALGGLTTPHPRFICRRTVGRRSFAGCLLRTGSGSIDAKSR
jgi:hypothetical protein